MLNGLACQWQFVRIAVFTGQNYLNIVVYEAITQKFDVLMTITTIALRPLSVAPVCLRRKERYNSLYPPSVQKLHDNGVLIGCMQYHGVDC